MDSDKLKEQKDPKQEVIKIILSLLNSRKFNEAKKKIDKEIINFPKSSILFNILGAVFFSQNKLHDALINYNNSIKINPDYADVYNNLGTTYKQLGENEKSITNYEKAIEIQPKRSDAYNNVGVIFKESNSRVEKEFNISINKFLENKN